MYIWPIVSGASQAVGVLALNRALIYPSTAVVNVIAASNSIVVLLLNWILLGLVPGTPKIIGMFFVIAGVSLMTLWKPKEESSDDVVKEKDLKLPNDSTNGSSFCGSATSSGEIRC
mmetsp:Transcript_28028/g.23989  ORF Transcript_28028/g.23989 Transcript_28028/m.23989 type:complete len:116 (+) Transcript_28028:118-465(+)